MRTVDAVLLWYGHVRRPRLLAISLKLPLQRAVPSGAAGFVRSDCNAEAARVLDRWPDDAGRVMAICGPAGCGKSHLAAIWAERVGAVAASRGRGRPGRSDGAGRSSRPAGHRPGCRRRDPVSPDQPGPGRRRGPAAGLAPIAPALVGPGARTCARGWIPFGSWPWRPPDDVVLAAILRTRFAERSITPGDGVIDYLVRRIDRSAAAAADIVERLDAEHRPVTRVLARQVLDAADESGDLFD